MPELANGDSTPFAIISIACIAFALFLAYRLFKKRKAGEAERLKMRIKELNGLIKTTQLYFYTRKIAEDKANKLIIEYEEELRLSNEQLAKISKNKTSLKLYVIIHIIAIAALLILGILLMSLAMVEAPGNAKLESMGPEFEGSGWCSEEPDPNNRDECYSGAAMEIASDNGLLAIDYCKQIQSEKKLDECYSTISGSILESNVSLGFELCGLVNDTGYQRDCYLNFVNDPNRVLDYSDLAFQACAVIPKEGDNCYYQIARANAEIAPLIAVQACLNISDPNNRGGCITNEIIKKMDNASQILELCNTYVEEDQRGGCVREVCDEEFVMANFETARGQCCASLKSDERNSCYENIAMLAVSSDMDFALETCEMLGKSAFGSSAESCYQNMVRNVGNLSEKIYICQHLVGSWSADDCLNNLMNGVKSCSEVIELCDYQDDSASCSMQAILNNNYGKLAKTCPDDIIDVCAAIENSQQSDDCFYRLAQVLSSDNSAKARAACNEIEDEGRRSDCRDTI